MPISDDKIAAFIRRWSQAESSERANYALFLTELCDRLARIEYYRSRSGPAWRFSMPGTKHHFSLYGDCQRLLKGREARGNVP
jgi:hypothetical protein